MSYTISEGPENAVKTKTEDMKISSWYTNSDTDGYLYFKSKTPSDGFSWTMIEPDGNIRVYLEHDQPYFGADLIEVDITVKYTPTQK